MDGIISKQAAIDALERIFDRCEEIEAHLSKGDPDRVGYKMYPDWLTVWKYLHQLPSAQPEPLIKDGIVIGRNLCDSCINNGCMFQYGIVRNHCDFYKAERRDDESVV